MKAYTKFLMPVAVGLLASCSYCWPSLHTAEAVLHRDKQVVVNPHSGFREHHRFKYRYKGKDYYPVVLVYAVDKGDDIYRRGDGRPWCPPDTADRYVLQPDSARTYMCAAPQRGKYGGYAVGLFAERLIPEQDFPYAEAKRIKVSADDIADYIPRFRTYEPVQGAVDGMPITEPAEPVARWRRAAAVPLEFVDFSATTVMVTTELAGIIAILPFAAVYNGIAKIFNG